MEKNICVDQPDFSVSGLYAAICWFMYGSEFLCWLKNDIFQEDINWNTRTHMHILLQEYMENV